MQCFEQLAKRETLVWELWGNETDRANALKKKGCNLRRDSSFLLAWDAAKRSHGYTQLVEDVEAATPSSMKGVLALSEESLRSNREKLAAWRAMGP